MYTGQHVPQTGVIDNVGVTGQSSMSTEIPTIGHRLRDLGYVTAYKGKWHLATDVRPGRSSASAVDLLEPYGFSDYNDDGDYVGFPYEGDARDGGIANGAINWLTTRGAESNRRGKPWFLSVNFVNPHDIMYGTSDEVFIAGNRDRPKLGGFTGLPDNDHYAAKWDLPDEPSWLDPLNGQVRPSAHLDFATANKVFTGEAATNIAELRHFRNYYLNCLRSVDIEVGRLLDALEESGHGDDTVVMYTSDHGELAGAHGLFGKGPCSYEENIRLPLIVVDPARTGGVRASAITSQFDLAPMITALADGAAPPAAQRDAALFAYEGLLFLDGEWSSRTRFGGRVEDQVEGRDLTKRGFMRTLIGDRYKFSRYFAPAEYNRPTSVEDLLALNTLELFDLLDDPNELVNLATNPKRLPLVEDLDRQLSELIDAEIGDDHGQALPSFPGAPWMT
jgi:arylsulfatase A-like enzyme